MAITQTGRRAKRPPRLTRAEAKAETRRRVLEAAGTVFCRDGYHGASLDRVAAEAGFTKGAVYSSFESKADLMLALLAARAERMRADWTEILAGAATVEDFVAENARRNAARVSIERDWLAAVNEFVIVAGRDEKLRARYAELHEVSRSALAASVRTWMRRTGERMTMSPQRVATAVIALHKGLVLEGMAVPTEVPEELFVEAQLALLHGARAGGKRRRAR